MLGECQRGERGERVFQWESGGGVRGAARVSDHGLFSAVGGAGGHGDSRDEGQDEHVENVEKN